ncbi:MAG: molybdate ABC transporter permease subunit [Aquificota bacterium]|nr:molybdate ABC transporter permease subunit [Aquificota bacterium]
MLEALLISLKLSLLTTLILLSVSIPISYLIAYRNLRGKEILEALLVLPILLPPTVLGFYLLYIFSPSSPLGKVISLFSFEALLVGSVIYSLPFGVFPVKDAFSGIDRRYIETAYVFGYSPLETFLKVILPLSSRGVFTATALVFAHTMGEFGVVLMIGGNIPGETRTLSIYIYDEVQALNYSEAHRASLLLLSVSLVALVLILLFRRRWQTEYT